MSGGAYDYIGYQIQDFANDLKLRPVGSAYPERQAFIQLLERVAAAAYAIEWVDSGDLSPGEEIEDIRAALGAHADDKIYYAAAQSAKEAVQALQSVLSAQTKVADTPQ